MNINKNTFLIDKFYSRQIKIPEIGETGQIKIMSSALLVNTYDTISKDVIFLCASIGFRTIFLRDPDDYRENLKIRNPFLNVEKIEDLDFAKFERLYIIGNNKRTSFFSNKGVFHVNFKKDDTTTVISFSKYFEFWKYDTKNTVDKRMLACILTSEIVKHIVDDEFEKVVEIEFPEVFLQ